jgi:radical SAM protein with 4Fe4S-binding SPASM domain
VSGCTNKQLLRHGGLAGDEHAVQKRYFAEKQLYTLQIESTDACPQDCVFWYAGATSTESRGLTDAEIRALLEDAVALGIRAIDWLGGDPLVRPGWYEHMRFACDLGLINNVWTSGLPLVDPELAARVHEVTDRGFVSVHVDSIFAATLARMRRGGDAGQFDAVVAGVDNLMTLGMSPDRIINCITFTSIQDPADAIETIRWWRERKGVRMCLTMFNPTGKGAQMASLEPMRDAVRLVFRERDRINYADDSVSLGAMDTDKFYCGTMAAVTFTGEVTPCSVIREGVDNIRANRLPEIVRRHIDTLVHACLHGIEGLGAPCDACRHNDHCWGCRASAYHYSGQLDGPDPKCWRVSAHMNGEDS